uniref:Uncharacterized protein n=1 Tax=Oryza sativa subsp. japonica TaxID=39947 RepID=Q9AYF1_ORYSJ|nr:Hypothetical protein [Oryza sativa Japonica Group]
MAGWGLGSGDGDGNLDLATRDSQQRGVACGRQWPVCRSGMVWRAAIAAAAADRSGGTGGDTYLQMTAIVTGGGGGSRGRRGSSRRRRGSGSSAVLTRRRRGTRDSGRGDGSEETARVAASAVEGGAGRGTRGAGHGAAEEAMRRRGEEATQGGGRRWMIDPMRGGGALERAAAIAEEAGGRGWRCGGGASFAQGGGRRTRRGRRRSGRGEEVDSREERARDGEEIDAVGHGNRMVEIMRVYQMHLLCRQEDGVRPRREHAYVRLRDTVVLLAVVVVAVTNGVAVLGGGADALRLPICGLGGAAAARRRDVKRAAAFDGEGNLIPSVFLTEVVTPVSPPGSAPVVCRRRRSDRPYAAGLTADTTIAHIMDEQDYIKIKSSKCWNSIRPPATLLTSNGRQICIRAPFWARIRLICTGKINNPPLSSTLRKIGPNNCLECRKELRVRQVVSELSLLGSRLYYILALDQHGLCKGKRDGHAQHQHLHHQQDIATSSRITYEVYDNDLARVESKLPVFDGKYDSAAYVNWELAVDKQFDEYDFSNAQMIKAATNKCTGQLFMLACNVERKILENPTEQQAMLVPPITDVLQEVQNSPQNEKNDMFEMSLPSLANEEKADAPTLSEECIKDKLNGAEITQDTTIAHIMDEQDDIKIKSSKCWNPIRPPTTLLTSNSRQICIRAPFWARIRLICTGKINNPQRGVSIAKAQHNVLYDCSWVVNLSSTLRKIGPNNCLECRKELRVHHNHGYPNKQPETETDTESAGQTVGCAGLTAQYMSVWPATHARSDRIQQTAVPVNPM